MNEFRIVPFKDCVGYYVEQKVATTFMGYRTGFQWTHVAGFRKAPTPLGILEFPNPLSMTEAKAIIDQLVVGAVSYP